MCDYQLEEMVFFVLNLCGIKKVSIYEMLEKS